MQYNYGHCPHLGERRYSCTTSRPSSVHALKYPLQKLLRLGEMCVLPNEEGASSSVTGQAATCFMIGLTEAKKDSATTSTARPSKTGGGAKV